MLIYIKSLRSRTQLSLNVSFKASIRLVGEKTPMGHIHKILNAVTKPEPPILGSSIQEYFSDNISPIDVILPNVPEVLTNTNPLLLEDTTPHKVQEQQLITGIPEYYVGNAQEGAQYWLKKLFYYGLLTYSKDGTEKLTSKYYSIVTKEGQQKLLLEHPENITEELCTFEIVILDVTKEKETIMLEGVQIHAGYICKLYKDGSRIFFGYLTSEKTAQNKKLTDYQPFNYDAKEPKEQMFHLLAKPFIVNENLVKQLPLAVLDDGRIIDQHKVGLEYTEKNQKTLLNIYNTEVIQRMKKENFLLNVYDGAGVTSASLQVVVEKANIDSEIRAKKLFDTYRQKLGTITKIKVLQWCADISNHETQSTRDKLYAKINQYEKAYNQQQTLPENKTKS